MKESTEVNVQMA